MRKTLWVLVMIALMMLSTAAAQLSAQLKRTNPGIAGEKSAELIFDIVNTDLTHQIEGFLWCKSPDDATISSTYGVGSGSGAQYISPLFVMDVGPSQTAMTLTLNADTAGDKRTGCYVKYIPFKTTSVEEVVTREVTTTTAVLDDEGNPVLDEDGNAKTTESTETITETVTKEVKQFKKMNSEYVDKADLIDSHYRQIRLDKTVPFAAAAATNPQCPEGQNECKSSELVYDLGEAGQIPKIWLLVGALGVVLLVVYMLGKTSRKD